MPLFKSGDLGIDIALLGRDDLGLEVTNRLESDIRSYVLHTRGPP